MPPEVKLAIFAKMKHLQEKDVYYILSLMGEARVQSSRAGQKYEREQCAKLADKLGAFYETSEKSVIAMMEGDIVQYHDFSDAIRARSEEK